MIKAAVTCGMDLLEAYQVKRRDKPEAPLHLWMGKQHELFDAPELEGGGFIQAP